MEEESNRLPAEMGKNVTYSLFAYPAEDNFAGVKYPLDWIEKIHNGHFHDVIPLRSLNRRATSGSSFSTRLPSFPPAGSTYPPTSPISSASPSTSCSGTRRERAPSSSATST